MGKLVKIAWKTYLNIKNNAHSSNLCAISTYKTGYIARTNKNIEEAFKSDFTDTWIEPGSLESIRIREVYPCRVS